MGFRAIYVDRNGTRKDRILEVATHAEALAKLQSDDVDVILNLRRLLPLERMLTRGTNGHAGKAMRLSQVQAFARSLGAYLKAGIPVQEALRLTGLAEPGLQSLCEAVKTNLSRGKSLDQALRETGYGFPLPFLALVKVGSEAGMLAQSLELEARRLQSTLSIRRDLSASMIYPVALLVLCICVILFMLGSIVPQLKSVMTNDAVRQAPVLSQAIFAASDHLVETSVWVWTLLAAMIGITIWFISWRFRGSFERLLLRLPVIGVVLKHLAAANFCFSMGTMLAAAIRMDHAWRLASGGLSLQPVRLELEQAGQRIVEGMNASMALKDCRALPDDVQAIFALGERTGTLSSLLLETAEFHSAEAVTRLRKLAAMIAPVLILIAGLVVGTFAVAMMTTILSVNQIQ